MAKLTEDLFAVADGEIYPRWFKAGEDVSGDVERTARSRGIIAQEQSKRAPRRKAMTPPENKRAPEPK